MPFEKIRKNDRDSNLMYDFRETTRECDLLDLRSKRRPITWSNKRYNTSLTEKRLDRFLGNKSWGKIFLELVAEH